MCDEDCVEDEKHFLFKCKKYKELRLLWLTALGVQEDIDTNLDREDIYSTMFKYPRQTAKYVTSAIECRKKTVYIDILIQYFFSKM